MHKISGTQEIIDQIKDYARNSPQEEVEFSVTIGGIDTGEGGNPWGTWVPIEDLKNTVQESIENGCDPGVFQYRLVTLVDDDGYLIDHRTRIGRRRLPRYQGLVLYDSITNLRWRTTNTWEQIYNEIMDWPWDDVADDFEWRTGTPRFDIDGFVTLVQIKCIPAGAVDKELKNITAKMKSVSKTFHRQRKKSRKKSKKKKV